MLINMMCKKAGRIESLVACKKLSNKNGKNSRNNKTNFTMTEKL